MPINFRAPALGSGIITCTSSTRPAPVVGLTIYETDTAKYLTFAGATSGWQPPWNLPWGFIGSANATGSGFNATILDVSGATVTFTAIAGRKYRISGEIWLQLAGTNVHNMLLRDGANTTIETNQFSGAINDLVAGEFSIVQSPVAGATTYKLSAFVTGGGGAILANTVIHIHDIGPNALPS